MTHPPTAAEPINHDAPANGEADVRDGEDAVKQVELSLSQMELPLKGYFQCLRNIKRIVVAHHQENRKEDDGLVDKGRHPFLM